MRVKLTLLPPFQNTKIILPIAETVKTIHDLKKHILQSLSLVSQHASKAKELVLEIDGFELLAGSEVGVIEGGDIVTVRLAPGGSKVQLTNKKTSNKKRKSSTKEKDADPKISKRQRLSKDVVKNVGKSSQKKQVAEPCKPKNLILPLISHEISNGKRARSLTVTSSLSSSSSNLSSSSAASSSSSSSRASDSSLTSSSSSLSSSSSDASSSLNSAPIVQSSNPYPVLSKPTQSSKAHVPPGQGKSVTKNRNARRRMALQYKKLAAQQSQTKSSVNVGNPGRENGRTSESVVEAVTSTTNIAVVGDQQIPVPGSMSNRNKKKGFLKDMKEKRGTKTLFDRDHNQSSAVLPEQLEGPTQASFEAIVTGKDVPLPFEDTSFLPYELEGPSTSTPRKDRMIPPSQIQDIPSNIFITSVEFPRAPVSPRRKQRGKLPAEDMEIDAKSNEGEGAECITEEVSLNQGIKDEHIWKRLDRDFDTLPALSLETYQNIKQDDRLTCKELELDLMTFSPGLVIKLARAIQVTGGKVQMEWVQRPVVDEYDGYHEGTEAIGHEVEGDGKFVLDREEVAAEKWKTIS
ncbi:uncharacterized protein IL334_002127 [Kwoniella shivajii]|uniref:Coilin n=1 Tax=Kwoniella shivajii TaxID=564305 RepID=A0ABZ1CTU4_9TREE|nr:hypothetical protein IL334_002127 [Kwoniella shivajii]